MHRWPFNFRESRFRSQIDHGKIEGSSLLLCIIDLSHPVASDRLES